MASATIRRPTPRAVRQLARRPLAANCAQPAPTRAGSLLRPTVAHKPPTADMITGRSRRSLSAGALQRSAVLVVYNVLYVM